MIRPLIYIALTVTAFVIYSGGSSSTLAQRRDLFSHSTASHKKLTCNACHKTPTANWITARGFPDVADFPGHAACFSCHSPRSVFVGNKPPFCAICHVDPGPRGVARLKFPVASRSEEFTIKFPHNIHQDILATNFVRTAPSASQVRFVKAGFTVAADDPPQFNNCAICHETLSAMPKTAPRIPASIKPLADAVPDAFVPKPSFFKGMPRGHSSCFTCHYEGVKPTATECASCHSLTVPHTDSQVVPRYSLKFEHQQKEHALRDCMTCHVRISQNADLKSMRDADVPIMTCSTSSCHGAKILEEIGRRESSVADKQTVFQCSYCHISEVGRFPVPASHQVR